MFEEASDFLSFFNGWLRFGRQPFEAAEIATVGEPAVIPLLILYPVADPWARFLVLFCLVALASIDFSG